VDTIRDLEDMDLSPTTTMSPTVTWKPTVTWFPTSSMSVFTEEPHDHGDHDHHDHHADMTSSPTMFSEELHKNKNNDNCPSNTKTIKDECCSNVIIVGDWCFPGDPHYDPEGSVCENDGEFNEAYCSYDIGPNACAYCGDHHDHHDGHDHHDHHVDMSASPTIHDHGDHDHDDHEHMEEVMHEEHSADDVPPVEASADDVPQEAHGGDDHATDTPADLDPLLEEIATEIISKAESSSNGKVAAERVKEATEEVISTPRMTEKMTK